MRANKIKKKFKKLKKFGGVISSLATAGIMITTAIIMMKK